MQNRTNIVKFPQKKEAHGLLFRLYRNIILTVSDSQFKTGKYRVRLE